MGTLKLRDMKLQDRNLRHKNAGVETARHGISGTKMQGWKLRDMESAAQKCRGGNCETWNQRHKNAGVEIAAQASMESQNYIYCYRRHFYVVLCLS